MYLISIAKVLLLFNLFRADKPTGYDRVRNAEIGNKDFELDVLEEAYTTEHWIVRIYKVSGRARLPSLAIELSKFVLVHVFR